MTDKIFLLSKEEYERYKNVIPPIKTWWWLRSPDAYDSESAGDVDRDGWVHRSDVDDYDGARPALRIDNLESSNLKLGQRIMLYDFPWVVIDVEEPLAIAEVPIGFHRFDSESNDYETSEIRQYCLDWLKARTPMTNREKFNTIFPGMTPGLIDSAWWDEPYQEPAKEET